MRCSAIVGRLPRCRRTVVALHPTVDKALYPIERHHIIGGTVGVDDGNGACTGKRHTTHGITTDRGEGGNKVGNLCHGMVGEHTSHRETGEIDAVTVNLIVGHHLVDDGLHEVDISIATDIPCVIDTLWEDSDKLSSICHGLNLEHALLVVGVL